MIEQFLTPLLAWLGIGFVPFLILLCVILLLIIILRG